MKQNMDLSIRIRKGSLYSFIAFLAISALLAIISVLFGNFNLFEVKIIITTSAIAAASICSLCCSAYTSRSRKLWPGGAGVTLAGVCAALLIIGVWTEVDIAGYWKTTAVIGIFGIAVAQTLALLAVRLQANHSWFQVVTALTILVLASLISAMILTDSYGLDTFKLIAVFAILVALETLVIPILGGLAGSEPSRAKETLSLTQREDGMYEDTYGRLYEVNERHK